MSYVTGSGSHKITQRFVAVLGIRSSTQNLIIFRFGCINKTSAPIGSSSKTDHHDTLD